MKVDESWVILGNNFTRRDQCEEWGPCRACEWILDSAHMTTRLMLNKQHWLLSLFIQLCLLSFHKQPWWHRDNNYISSSFAVIFFNVIIFRLLLPITFQVLLLSSFLMLLFLCYYCQSHFKFFPCLLFQCYYIGVIIANHISSSSSVSLFKMYFIQVFHGL